MLFVHLPARLVYVYTMVTGQSTGQSTGHSTGHSTEIGHSVACSSASMSHLCSYSGQSTGHSTDIGQSAVCSSASMPHLCSHNGQSTGQSVLRSSSSMSCPATSQSSDLLRWTVYPRDCRPVEWRASFSIRRMRMMRKI